MTSEDLTKVLLAFIAMIGSIMAPAIIWFLNKSRMKDNTRGAKIANMENKLAANTEITVAIADKIRAVVDPGTVESALAPPKNADATPVSQDAQAVVDAIGNLNKPIPNPFMRDGGDAGNPKPWPPS